MALLINNLCCRALDDSETCEHKTRYLEAESYVRSQGVRVGYAPDGAKDDSWRVGRSNPDPPGIVIWTTAFEIYGWEIVTSVLIHEYGHCKLYEAERICDDSIEAERKANDYGSRYMPPNLVPTRYEEHRRFFLQSYETRGRLTTRDHWLEAIRDWPGTEV
jgi:hypothetical protein